MFTIDGIISELQRIRSRYRDDIDKIEVYVESCGEMGGSVEEIAVCEVEDRSQDPIGETDDGEYIYPLAKIEVWLR